LNIAVAFHFDGSAVILSSLDPDPFRLVSPSAKMIQIGHRKLADRSLDADDRTNVWTLTAIGFQLGGKADDDCSNNLVHYAKLCSSA
jgi:hypothetical protein